MNKPNRILRMFPESALTGKGLEAKLLVSHLSIAALGVAILCMALLSAWYLNKQASELATESAPAAQASLRVLSGIQTSLAATRGWLSVGDTRFKQERADAWEKIVYPAFNRLSLLTHKQAEADLDSLNEIHEKLVSLEESQWWIEDVAWTPGNEPARDAFNLKFQPVSDSLLDAINGLIFEEIQIDSTTQRSFLLGHMESFRFYTSKMASLLHQHLNDGDEYYASEYKNYFKRAKHELKKILGHTQELSSEQSELYQYLGREFIAITQVALKILSLRKNTQWNIAQNRMTTDAVPLAREIIEQVEALSNRNEMLAQGHAESVKVMSRLANIGSVFLLIIILGVAIYLSRRGAEQLIEPIATLASATQRFASGQLNEDIPITSDDELGELTDSFNRMREKLNASQKELKQTNAKLEQRVEARTADLARSNDELQQFAYVASHDLQEPLRTVSSFLELLSDKYKDQLDEDANKFINFACDGSARMQSLIRDLLEYSRVGSTGVSIEPVALSAVVDIVRQNLSIALQDHSATLQVGDLPVVLADEGQLVQLMQNLIGNAIKFRRPEQPVTVVVEAQEHNGGWQVSIQDNGIGIAPEFSERIFQIFQRLHGRDEYEGTGIGLSVCKKIVSRHRGKIWLESTPGKGTTFYFTLQNASKISPPPVEASEKPVFAQRDIKESR